MDLVTGGPTIDPVTAGKGDELRPLTALFADIVGSTSLGERLPPGEVKALIGECVSRMSRAAEEFGGTIQAYTGDGICVYFGVPVAHEDDPERAARSALRILEIAGEYAREVEAAWGITDFNVRVGINSGQAGVGMVGGSDPQQVALGDATNVAARLQAAAAPGTIAVGPETARRLPASFRLEPMGEIAVKGRTVPVPAWRLAGLGAASEPAPITPLVGRELEMARLASLLRELQAGRGQVLLMFGDAGIGKTRLLTELRMLSGDSVEWLQGACPSYFVEALPGPFVQILRSWLGVDETTPDVVVRMRLRARFGELYDEAVAAVLSPLGAMLGIRIDDASDRTASTPAQEARDAAYASWIERLATRRPVALAVDDFHWAHPFTRSLAERLLALTDRAPVLLTAAFRPDPSSEAWPFRLRVLAEYPHRCVEIPVGPLTPHAAGALADLLLPSGVLDEATRTGIVARAEGNPLYLEELVKGVAESLGGERSKTWSLSLRQILPSSLESLLVARIDRLSEAARRLVQTAAVIGREFPVQLLRKVVGDDRFDEGLASLFRADLIRELRRYPELVCAFRHGLVQEAALSTLTTERLRDLYRQVGKAFEELYVENVDDQAERLAFYFYRGEDFGRAREYLERAAEHVVAFGSSEHAQELLGRALKAAEKSGDEESGHRLGRRLSELGGP